MKSINVSIKRESELCNSPSFQESNDKGLGISNKRKRAYVNDNFLTLILLILVDYLYTNGSTSEITQPVLDQNQENTQICHKFHILDKNRRKRGKITDCLEKSAHAANDRLCSSMCVPKGKSTENRRPNLVTNRMWTLVMKTYT